MRENKVRTIWQTGGAANNGWLAIPSIFSAETMAHQGWDSLTIDMQHGVIGYQDALAMLTAISTTGAAPIVRVPWLNEGEIMKMLDAGAYGIICPMINTRKDAERFAAAMRYAPSGVRSFGPVRALLYAGPDYAAKANETVIGFAMIETREALGNLEDILSVPGLDAIYIGPADLSLSLGCTPKFDQDEKPVVEAIEHILSRARAHGIRTGIFNGTPAYALKMIEKGFDFVTVGSDARYMAAGAREAVAAMKAGEAPVKLQASSGY